MWHVMGRESTVTSVMSSSHHCGTRTERSLDRDERRQGPHSDRQEGVSLLKPASWVVFHLLTAT